MNRHLASDEIARRMLGDVTPEWDEHLRNCPQCESEVISLERSLCLFRQSAHTWADERCGPDDATLNAIRQAPYRLLVYRLSAFALAVALCLLIFTSLWQKHNAAASTPQINDAILLQSIHKDLSETLPTSLGPLKSAVSWEISGHASPDVRRLSE